MRKPDPGPWRGADGGPVTPAATSGDLRGAVQRRTDVQRARAIQTLGFEDWKGLTGGESSLGSRDLTFSAISITLNQGYGEIAPRVSRSMSVKAL